MLGEHLRTIREKQTERVGRKVYQRDAARICGIHEDRYRAYEYGRAQLPEECAKALAGEWGIHWKEFYQLPRKKTDIAKVSRKKSSTFDDTDSDVGPPTIPAEVLDAPLPYIGYIAAGSRVEWSDPFAVEDMEYVPAEMAERGRFCCRVKGDSCYPELWPGDLVVFQINEAPKLGSIVLHRTLEPDPQATIKQLKHDGQKYYLHPLNPAYTDEPATGLVLGHLVALVREVNGIKITMYKRGDALARGDLNIFQMPG